MVFEATRDAIPAVPGLDSRLLMRLDKLRADKGDGCYRSKCYLRWSGIGARLARKGVKSEERLGRYRWIVERVRAAFAASRRLRIRFEHRLGIHSAPPSWLLLSALASLMTFINRSEDRAADYGASPQSGCALYW